MCFGFHFIVLLKHVSGEKSIDEDVHLLYYDVMNNVDWNYEIHSFGITKCRDDWTWDTEKQPSADYDLWIVLGGNGHVHTKEHVYEVSEGSCMLLRPGGCYRGSQNPDNHLAVFHTHFDAVGKDESLIPLEEHFPLFRELYDFLFIRQLLFKMLDSLSREQMREASHWMQVVLDEIANQDEKNDLKIPHPVILKIRQLCDQIQKNPGKRFSLREVSESAGYSPDYFGRLFKKTTGHAFSDYIVSVRMNQARTYLKNSNSSIESIAGQLGYEDTGFFCRQFKRRMGCSPGQYRNL